MSKSVFANAVLTPDRILAADSTEFSIRLEVGKGYTGEASRIVFDFSCTLGTSCPTHDCNESSGYVEVYVTNPDVEYKYRLWDLDYKYFVDNKNPASREAMRMVVLDLSEGLVAGDIIELKWGETLGGFGPGAKVTSVVPRPDYKARIDVRYFDSHDKGMPDHGRDYIGYKRPVPDELVRLEYEIIPRDLKRMRLIRKVDQAMLVPYDVFWNIARVDALTDVCESPEAGTKNEQGVFEFENKNIQIRSSRVKLTESATMDQVFEGNNIYWGDIHTHSAYSIDCAQRSGMDMLPGDLMKFARFRSALDFYAVTDHHIPWKEPIRHVGKDKWEKTLADIAASQDEGKFVVFPGIEFTDRYGDICLIFKREPDYEKMTQPHLKNVSDFAEIFGEEMMAIPHLHSYGGKEFGEWRQKIDHISPVLEVYSDHGSYEAKNVLENGRAWIKPFREDNCAEYYLTHGCRYGLIANSDDHKGHVGVNGLTAVYAKDLSRESLFEAYFNRHVYGTTNARIRLLFTANGKLMGSTLKATDSKTFYIDVIGESALKKVDLFHNCKLHKRFYPEGISFQEEYAVDGTDTGCWYVRVTQQDNHIAYSSPVWFV